MPKYGIKNVYSTPRYPQFNGQAEVTNKTLFAYLKRRLTSAKGRDELTISLYAYHRTPKQPIGENVYALVFEAKALISIESGLEIMCTNDASELSHALDELKKERDQTAVKMAEYHHQALCQRG